MSARTAIETQRIVEEALALVRESGWESVTARSLAARLGCSTMPIYSAIGSMEELRRRVFVAAARALHAAQRIRRTDNEALDLALGYVLFARDEPRLFRFVMANQRDMAQDVVRAAAEPGEAGGIGDVELVRETLEAFKAPTSAADFVLSSWIFVNGLAFLVSEGGLVMEQTEIERRLAQAGGAFYAYEKAKEERE